MAQVPFWTNHEAVEATELPASMIVLGGGAIGCELAQVFARFGARVTIVEAADHLLPMEEPEAGDLLQGVLEAEGLSVLTGTAASRVDADGDGVAVMLAGGSVVVGTGSASVPSTARGWIHKVGNEGLIKLVADSGRGVLVGATSMGPAGGEVLGSLTVAVHAQVPLATLRSMIYAYPTFHRGIEDALRDLSTTEKGPVS